MICGCRTVGVRRCSHRVRNTLTHANRALGDVPSGRGWGKLVLVIFQLWSSTEPWALPGQMANELSRGDRGPDGF